MASRVFATPPAGADHWTTVVLNPDFATGIGGWYKALGDPSTVLSWDPVGALTWNTPAVSAPWVAFNSNTFPIAWPAGVTRFRMRVAWRGGTAGDLAALVLVAGPTPIDTVWRPPGAEDPTTPPVRTIAQDTIPGVQGADLLWRASVVVEVPNTAGDSYLGFLWRVLNTRDDYAPRVEYAYLERADEPLGEDISCNVDAVSIQYGRSGNTGQPDPMACTLDVSADDAIPLDAALDIGSRITVETDKPGGGVSTRFVGRVTDITYAWEDGGELPPVAAGQVVAVGRLADTGRADVAGTFAAMTDSQLVRALMARASIPVTADPGAVNMLALTVSPPGAVSGPLGDVLQDSLSVLWETPAGDLMWASLRHRDTPPATLLQLDACDIVLSPQWRRDLDGVANVVTVVYGPTPAGDTPRPSLTAYDADSAEQWGQLAATHDTQLRAIGDASEVAAARLYWHGAPVWQLNSIPLDFVDLDDGQRDAVLELLMHDVVELTDLPGVAGRPEVPTRVVCFVEGWSEVIAYGTHTITLNVTPVKDPDAYITPGQTLDYPHTDVGDRTAAPITPWSLSEYATFTDGRYRWDGDSWVAWVAADATWAAATPAWEDAGGSWETWTNQ